MGKNEIVVEVAKKMGIAQKDVREVVEMFLDECVEAIAALEPGQKFSLSGVGAWHKKAIAAHKGRNPKTAEVIDIPASEKVSFKAAKGLKDAVKG